MDNQSHIKQLIKSHEGLIEVLQKDLQKLKEMQPSTPEPKEPETWEQVWSEMFSGKDAVFFPNCDGEVYKSKPDLSKKHLDQSSEELTKKIIDFAKRLLIADYCGRREYIEGDNNYFIEKYKSEWKVEVYLATEYPAANYFPTKEASEKYLKICLNSNLL